MILLAIDKAAEAGKRSWNYINAASQFATEFRACQLAGDHYPEYRDIKPVRTEERTDESAYRL